MQRLILACALVTALVAAPSAAAPSEKISKLRVPVDLTPRGGVETTFVCGELERAQNWFQLGVAAEFLFPARISRAEIERTFSRLTLTVDRAPKLFTSSCVVAVRAVATPLKLGRWELPATARKTPHFDAKKTTAAAIVTLKNVALRNPFFVRVSGTRPSKKACRILLGDGSGVGVFADDEGANWGEDWVPVVIRGKRVFLRPSEVTPGLLERVCGSDSPRAARVAAQLPGRRAAPPPPPPAALQLALTATHHHGPGATNLCWTLSTKPPRAGLAGRYAVRALDGSSSGRGEFLTGADGRTVIEYRVGTLGEYELTATHDGGSVTHRYTVAAGQGNTATCRRP